jgi:hypothetical protein
MPSMIVSKKLIPALKKAMFTATAVLALMQCSEEDEFVNPTISDPSAEAVSAGVLSVESLTVTGTNTTFARLNDCKTCTYIVAEEEEVIDGSVFKPGDIICLNKGVSYGNLEFINLEGTTENPIIIAKVGGQITSVVAETSSVADPY